MFCTYRFIILTRLLYHRTNVYHERPKRIQVMLLIRTVSTSSPCFAPLYLHSAASPSSPTSLSISFSQAKHLFIIQVPPCALHSTSHVIANDLRFPLLPTKRRFNTPKETKPHPFDGIRLGFPLLKPLHLKPKTQTPTPSASPTRTCHRQECAVP